MMMQTTGNQRRALIGIAFLAGIGLAVPSAARATVNFKQDLTSTGVDPNAAGKIKVKVGKGRHGGTAGRLDVVGKHLRPGATFSVTVRGVPIGTLTTNAGGAGKARFRSEPKSPTDQPLGVDPRGEHLAVDDDGDEVLETDVDDDSVDPTEIRCCGSGDGEDGSECETMPADECKGTNLGPGSCLPNPCGDSTGGAFVRCCEDDDSESECDLETEASCGEHHGVSIGAGTCDPNPCGPPPPPEGEVRCCIPDGQTGSGRDSSQTEFECEHLTEADCSAAQGTSKGPGSCDPNPCGSPSAAFVDAP